MIAKAKYMYKCPKCGIHGGGDVAPTAVPWCFNDEEHHHRRGIKMEWWPEKSKNKEPKYEKETDK